MPVGEPLEGLASVARLSRILQPLDRRLAMKHLVRLAAVAALALTFLLPAAPPAEAAGACFECLRECSASGGTSYDCINDICCGVCPH
jgi:hypothetical protein